MSTDRLIAVELDDRDLPPPTPDLEQERRVAIFDLLEENHFRILPREGAEASVGPYRLRLGVVERRLVFALGNESGDPVAEFHLALSPFRPIIKDYFDICDSYRDAVIRLSAAQIEAIDMGRRGIHDEGARLLRERLAGKVEVDHDTARRLFTLICVLHFTG